VFKNLAKNDVYRLNNTDVALNQGAINLKANSRNLLIRGISGSQVTEVKNDLKVIQMIRLNF
jgi:hypothetical protein